MSGFRGPYSGGGFPGPGSRQRYNPSFGNEHQQFPDTRGGIGVSQSRYSSYESHSDYNPPARRPYPGHNMGGYSGVGGSHTSFGPPDGSEATNGYAPATSDDWELTALQKDVRVLELDLKGMRREVADMSDSMAQLNNQLQTFLDRTQDLMDMAGNMDHLKKFQQEAGDKFAQLHHMMIRMDKYTKTQKTLNYKFNDLSAKKISQTVLELKKSAERIASKKQMQKANVGKRPVDDESSYRGLKQRKRAKMQGENLPYTCQLSHEILSGTELRVWNETISIVIPATKVFLGNHVVRSFTTKKFKRKCAKDPKIDVDFYGGREASNVVQAYFKHPVEDMNNKLLLPCSFMYCSDIEIHDEHSGRAMFLYKNTWVWFPFTSEVFQNRENQSTDLKSVPEGDWWTAHFYFKYPYPENLVDCEIRLIAEKSYRLPVDSSDETDAETTKETAEKATENVTSNEEAKPNTLREAGSSTEDSGAGVNVPVQGHTLEDSPAKEGQHD